MTDKEIKLERFRQDNKNAVKGQTVLTGSSLMEMFPVNRFLGERGSDIIVYNRAIGGYITDELMQVLDTCVFELEPKRVFINIGTNDLSDSRIPMEQIMEHYDSIISSIEQRLPGTEIYLMAYYPVNYEAAAENMKECLKIRTNEKITAANALVKQLAEKHGQYYIDINDGLKDEQGRLKAEYTIEGLRDELSMSLAKQSGYLDAQSTAPAAVFLNGKYYGFAWLHQNFSRAYLEERYGGTKDNYQVVGKAEGELDNENAEGAIADYNKMLELAESGLTDDKKFEQLCSMMDIDNYMHYLAMQLFIDNRDWPGNNYKVWRYVASEGEEVTSKYQDGKWRYFFYDAEFAWGLYSDGYANKTLTKILKGTHPAGGSALVSALMERADMREKLANNICDLIGGAFSTENILATLEQKLADSDKEQMYALNKGITSEWANEGTFENSRNEIREFADKRANIILGDICRNFEIDKDDTYKVKLNGAKGLKVTMNIQTVKDTNTISAEYFTPYKVKLAAEDLSGYTFTSWEINGTTYTDREITIDSSMAKKGKITINARSEKTTSTDELLHISEVYTGGDADWIELYNPNDTDVSTRGLYLTDKEDMLNRYKIPTVNVKPHSTLTIVCKNNKSENTLMKMQTNFSLKTGETLILSNENGDILGKVAIIDCDENESLVRQRDGSYAKGTPTFEKNNT